MASKESKDLADFLSKVDELESIVKGLRSEDDTEVKSAMTKADDMIAKVQATKDKDPESNDPDDVDLPKTKTGFSKTVINSLPSTPAASGVDLSSGSTCDQGALMAAMEADAKERAERKREREKEASEIKEEGNKEFRTGNYQKAFDLYSMALTKVRDNTVLYTNRAQTCIKMQKYELALVDCEWALRVHPNCIKAHIHMGRAYLGLSQYNKARESYNKALACDPKKETMIKEYICEVDRLEVAYKQEARARELFELGGHEVKGIVELIKKVKKIDQLPLFYSGGFRMLCHSLRTTEERTMFRTKGGLTLITDHSYLSRCISASPRSLSKEELDMLTSALEMFAAACTTNETNQQQFLQTDGLPDKILRFMEVKIKGQGKMVKSSCLNLLHVISYTDVGRSTIVISFNVTRLLAVLFTLIKSNANLSKAAVKLLGNLALDKKFKQNLQDKIEENVLPAFESLLSDESSELAVIPSCISAVFNLADNEIIRSKLANRKLLWEACLNVLSKHKEKVEQPLNADIVASLLGLIMNMSLSVSNNLRAFGVTMCMHCLALSKMDAKQPTIVSRSLGVLSHILPHSIPGVDWVCENEGALTFLQHIKEDESEENRKTALKCLVASTQINEVARKYIVDNKGLGALMRLLKHADDSVVGNAALCLSHCTQVPKVCAALAKTDIIQDLLVLARDTERHKIQQNCAILIAKLAQGDSRHLDRLRELHGIEILHSCMKYL